MLQAQLTPPPDIWADWLLETRQAGGTDDAARVKARVTMFADRVLDGMTGPPGMALLDMGAGSGAVGLRAIERFGAAVRVVFADRSERLLQHAAASADAAGVAGQCAFVRCKAEDLSAFADESFDAVAARAVLVYLPAKPAAARAILRVLKPGGMVSIGEPSFQREALRAIALRHVFQARHGVAVEPLLPLLCRWQAAQFPDTIEKMAADSMTNFTAQDLARWFAEAGFENVTLSEVIHPGECAGISWEAFLARSPHPLAPSLGEIMRTQFTPAERAYFEAAFKPRLASHRAAEDLMIYLRARKPGR